MEAPEYYPTDFGLQSLNESRYSSYAKTAGCNDNFIVEELLDFSNDEVVLLDANGSFDCLNVSSTDSSTVSILDSSNSSSLSGGEPASFPVGIAAEVQFSDDLCVPYDDLAELEWLSNFNEESFSSEDLQKLQLLSGMKAFKPDDAARNSPAFHSYMSAPAKARSKRSRAAPCIWTSSLPSLSPMSSSSETDIKAPVPPNPAKRAGRALPNGKPIRSGASATAGEGRKCLHCATDQTPQWRTGPMGPKTLCNACGVRFKSGRLVPEYRPAASPTFVLTKHSNSHRKVMELRRKKEIMGAHQNHNFHDQNMPFDVPNKEEYLINQHAVTDSVISSRW